MAAKLKVYQTGAITARNPRIGEILKQTGWRSEFEVFVVAGSKAQASEIVDAANVSNGVDEKNWRLAFDSKSCLALREAGLLNTLGHFLMIDARSSNSEVAMISPNGEVSSIGQFHRTGIDPGAPLVFLPTEVRWALKGSVALSRDTAFINTGRAVENRWASTDGVRLSEAQMQLALDLGEAKIIRAGYGEWWMPGL